MRCRSWGRYPKTTETLKSLRWSTDPLPANDGLKVLPHGLGRSYGDVCLNQSGTLLVTAALDHLLAFDEQNGLLRCESGVSLDEVLRFLVPRGWFLPTTPGTKFVTIGGAIANDVHGKNHHRAGTFGCHVTQFELLRSNGERLLCSRDKNADWFAATIGGLGLTGLITWAEFKVRRMTNAWIEMESIKLDDLGDFFAITRESDHDYEYTVSWLDCMAKGKSLGLGIFMRGNHAKAGVGDLAPHGEPRLSIPLDFPSFALNGLSIRAFNTLYYARLRQRVTKAVVHYNPFFYPLDSINAWNRIYGSRGFFQYQFVVPFSVDDGAIREILKEIGDSGQGSFLAVLKTFGDIPSPGLLSFPRPGVTLALDFPNRGAETFRLFERLDQIVLQAGGRIYPAKDARMSAATFQASYPLWRKFTSYIDPAFSSSFWRRVTS
ncbi:MAG: FAD-binding oxidoreductase [Methylacidiphilales bacterium]|nr:FAD-binding oxidoreductase [Candidatus Methylacidiphilales bacterium]